MLNNIRSIALLGFTFGVAASCVPRQANTDHCARQDGDATCSELYPDGSRAFCSRGPCATDLHDGCVADRPVDDACYSPCGGQKSIEDDPECDGAAEGSSSSAATEASGSPTSEPTGEPTTAGSMSASGSETEASSTTTSSGCTLSVECSDPGSPICVDMACVPCSSDEECLAKSPGAPACNEDGQCVTCTPTNASACTDTTPICNAANECEGCDFHEQCVGTACDIATGACFAQDCVVEVDGDGGADYQNIQAALVDGCVVVVHELNAGASYQQAVSVDGIKVAILAAAGEEPLLQGTGGNPSLNVTNDAVAYVQGLGINGNQMSGVGAAVDGATLYLDRTSVVGNSGGGILLSGGAAGHLRNCFVEGDSDIVAMTVDGSAADILYSTLGGQYDAPALLCTDPMEVTVRNSIMVSRATTADLACDDASITYTATEFIVPGEGNIALGDMNMSDATAWFDGYNTGDFSLNNPPAAVLTAAQWQAGDPLVDIDGELRPTEAGTADVAGADLP